MSYGHYVYDVLASAYESIFPPDTEFAGFIERFIAPPAFVLDVGCATGGHLAALALRGYDCLGIDPSPAMIAQAIKKMRIPEYSKLRFREGDMADIVECSRDRPSFDLVLCLGNTLPHAQSIEELREFFASSIGILRNLKIRAMSENKPSLIVQILNYKKILRERPSRLPSLETSNWRFERRYEYDLPSGKIRFYTRLSTAIGTSYPESSVELLPILEKDVIRYARDAGFSGAKSYASWSGTAFIPDESSILIMVISS
jgi:SAM-dependent methyltransferase